MEENDKNMELVISEVQPQKSITFNYEQLKNALNGKLEVYSKAVYTEETIQEAKKDRVILNKLSKALNDEKKRVKNELLKPYVDFEEKIKEIIKIVDDASSNIDAQVKSFEDKEKEQKLQEIIKYFYDKVGDYKELIDFDKIFQKQWLNKTFTINKVQAEINHIIAKTKMDIESFETSFEDKSIVQQAKVFYFANIGEPTVLSLTMQHINEINTMNEKISNVEETSSESKQSSTEKINENSPVVSGYITGQKVGRIFKLICSQEDLVKLNEFLQNGKYSIELLERFEVEE